MVSTINGYELEKEIPQEFLNEIKNDENYTEKPFPSEYITGKKGDNITDLSEIRDIFSDEDCFYAGHGTSDGIVDSILNEGLYAKDPESARGYMDTLRGLDSTIVEFGEGNQNLFNEKQEKLNNWPHKDASKVVIIEIPKEYILFLARYCNGDEYEPFYVQNNDEKGYQGLKLRPEFIRGIYDADTNSFIPNENFYKKLPKEEQERLLEEVKEQYIYRYAESVTLAPSESEYKLPLNEEELKKADLEWYRVQYKRMLESKKNENITAASADEDDDEFRFNGTAEEWDAMFNDDVWGEEVEEDHPKVH